MIHCEIIDAVFHQKVMALAPRDGLPVLTEQETAELEDIRSRYDVLIGIVDREPVGVEEDVAVIDRAAHPTWAGSLVDDWAAKTGFIRERTTIGIAKIEAFLYNEEVEQAACGLAQMPFDDLIQHLRETYENALLANAH